MEAILHYMYVVAIKDSRRAWAGDTPAQLCILGFWNLILMWFKVNLLLFPEPRWELTQSGSSLYPGVSFVFGL